MTLSVAFPRTTRLPRVSPSDVTFLLLNLVGLVAYLHPFLFASTDEADPNWFVRNADGPLVIALVGGLCMVLVVATLTEGGLNSRSLAALGVLAAMAAALRTITLPAGANLYFFLVILGGYAFGARLGFLLGAISFFVSALVTGGVGPWLPFQVFASAWMGWSAGLLRPVVEGMGIRGRAETFVVALFGIGWGLFFGAITNLWFWPFWLGGPDISYQPGIGLSEAIRRYWNFYFLTSFGWDLMRSICNVVIIAVVGGPLLKALLRFRDRFQWQRLD